MEGFRAFADKKGSGVEGVLKNCLPPVPFHAGVVDRAPRGPHPAR